MTLQLRYVAHSEIGLIRKNNQDSGYASPHLLVVADGMGGAAAGDLASAVAIDTIRKIDAPSYRRKQMLEVLAGAIHEANDKIAELVESDLSLEGMGTTVTGAMFDGAELGLAHIGDSRAYLFRDGHLERLTHDHTWVQSLVDDGKISESEAAMHPHRSLLLKVLNGQPTNDPDLAVVPVVAGDRLMFCSDGVCGLIDDDVIEAALQLPDLNDAAERLVVESLHEGGIDNITVIVADVVESGGSDEMIVLGAASEQPIPAPTAFRTVRVPRRTKPTTPSSPSWPTSSHLRLTTRSDTARSRRISDASVGRSSACSPYYSSQLPDSEWRTGGLAPSTSWAPTRTRSRSSKGCRKDSLACPCRGSTRYSSWR